MTFAELRRESIRVAERLATAGIGSNSLVSWVLPTSIDTLVLTAALSRLGAMQNPIIPVYRRARDRAHPRRDRGRPHDRDAAVAGWTT